jgi:hypothetical protein
MAVDTTNKTDVIVNRNNFIRWYASNPACVEYSAYTFFDFEEVLFSDPSIESCKFEDFD